MNLYQAAFESSPDAQAIMTFSPDRNSFRYVAANGRFFADTGLAEIQVIGKCLHDHLAPPHANALAHNFLRCLQENTTRTFETIVSVPSGTRNWHITAAPVHNTDASSPDTVVATARDITWSGDLAQRLNLIGDELPGFVYQLCHHPERQWHFTFVGNRVATMFGVKAHDVLQNANTLLGMVHPDDYDRIVNKSARDAQAHAHWHAEFRMLHPAGQTVWVEAYDMSQKLADGTMIWTGYLNDITSKKTLESSLQHSEARFRKLVENAYDIILNLDPDGSLDYVSPSWHELLGGNHTENIGRHLSGLLHPQDIPACNAYLATLQAGGNSHDGIEFRMRHTNGQWRWFVAHGTTVNEGINGRVNIMLIARDVTERRHMEQEIQYLAHHDPLTGLNNRVSFMMRVQHTLHNSRRVNKHFAILYIDLDRFKPVNDTLGHSAGDLLLQQVAQRLKENLRALDTVGRIGGDEFMVLLGEIANEAAALAVADKLCQALETPFLLGSTSVTISASIGAALYPVHGRDFDSLSNAADQAMYAIKAKNKTAGQSQNAGQTPGVPALTDNANARPG